jgi:hypothetical protein
MSATEKQEGGAGAELARALARLGHTIADAKDAKPAKSGEVIQFPLFPEDTRPVSNDVARSALFSCVQGKDRQTVKDALIATVEGVQIRFTGERFNQDDHDVLMQLVHIAAHKPLGEYVTVPAHSLLKLLGRKTGKTQHEQLRADLIRLRAGTVSLKNTRTRVEYIGGLIHDAAQDEESRYWIFQLNPKLTALYGSASHTLIDWEQRKNLKGKDLARWLQLYIASHAAPFPVKVATLRDLSGSKAAELKHFREALRRALNDLNANSDIAGWEIDPASDLVSITRGEAITDSQRRHLAKPKARRRKGTALERR